MHRLPGRGPVVDDRLAEVLRTSDRDQPDRQLLLCGGHLHDLIALAGQRDTGSLLAWQAGCLAASLTRRPAASPGPAGWLPRSLRRRPGGPASCPICLAAANAAQRTIDDLRASLRASHPAAGRRVPLCVRHLLGLRALDPWAGHVTAGGPVEHADMLIAELNEAFSKNTWAHRHEPRGSETTAWRRAAALAAGSTENAGGGRNALSARWHAVTKAGRASGDFQQPVVLGDAFPAGWGAGLQMAAAGAHGQVRDEIIA